ncbi:unnamed protein product [Brassica oleracea var. botrytis]
MDYGAHQIFSGKEDNYGGVVVNLIETEPMTAQEFESKLDVSLTAWKVQGMRGIWIKLSSQLSSLVDSAIKRGFTYHHAENEYVSHLALFLPINASHRIGIGAFVLNKSREVLVVQEIGGRFKGTGVWKLPTGIIQEGEDIWTGAVSEVEEETGIKTKFVEVLAFSSEFERLRMKKTDTIDGFVGRLAELSSKSAALGENIEETKLGEAFDKFKKFREIVEKETGARIKTLRTDRGGEFCSREFQAFCETYGITRHLTAPYSPQQNGIVERRNRTLLVSQWMPIEEYVNQPINQTKEMFRFMSNICLKRSQEKENYAGFSTVLTKNSAGKESYLYCSVDHCRPPQRKVAAADVSRRKGNNFTLSYLVESLGFTTKLAESILRKVTTEDSNCNPDSVLTLLRSHGFTNSHISTIIRTYPRLLSLDSESSLAPKLRFLTSRGASTSELTEVLSTVPKILGIKKDKALSRYYDFVREIIIATDKNYYSLPEGSAQGNKLRNVLVLRDMGVPQRLLLPLLISNHHVCCGKEKFEETLKKVVEMGFEPATFRFVEALRMLYQLSDKTIREKLCFYGKLGFSVGDVWEMFKKNPSFLPLSEKNVLNSIEAYLGLGFTRDEFAVLVKCHPQCLNYSAELVKKKTEFLVKSMNWPVKAFGFEPNGAWIQLGEEDYPEV